MCSSGCVPNCTRVLLSACGLDPLQWLGSGAQTCERQAVFRGHISASGNHLLSLELESLYCTIMTSQIDIGGVPSSLVNFISRRQPLAVAYLRDYLVSTSIEQSQMDYALD